MRANAQCRLAPMSAERATSRDQALSLIAEDAALACQMCRSDTALGVL
ncbi:DUF6233 domain-containing protein [Streptomyces sp. NPDC058409]